ncbi:inhibitor of growth protein 3-like [Saccoglossus kowalevskii]|uniref:Inhibitor of growth protein n=1 Tax=Saccoglossus kowalevskii TaxID=10224 RepID=A0ABM0MKQ9_SACKO|nr:PREDICTED: inhibitor of growth protein 3-like [Saccoglossus kowalevskii]
MLYLEDFLEMIEQLPMDLRERFTEMREMDLQVQNAADNLDERVKNFFVNGKKMKTEQRDQEYEKIRKDYYKALEDADEKVQIANQIYDLVDRHLRKLDHELNKFKMELEADNAGITEVLERRSLELDTQSQHNHLQRGEKRKYTSLENHVDKKVASEKLQTRNMLHEAVPESATGYRSNSSTPPATSAASTAVDSGAGTTQSSLLSYRLGQMSTGTNAIALAAAQAVSNTLQMQQGRRTASIRATYDALKSGADLTQMSGYTGLYNNATSTSSGEQKTADTTRTQRSKKQNTRNSSTCRAEPVPEVVPQEPVPEPVVAEADWTYDPNEPRYCICNQVSYGEMVGCDNDDCPIEWFHYGCVGLTEAPKGKWYCPQCTAAMKRRGRKL